LERLVVINPNRLVAITPCAQAGARILSSPGGNLGRNAKNTAKNIVSAALHRTLMHLGRCEMS